MFCFCPICNNARTRGGKELRRRSLAIIDDALVIDMPCDARDSLLSGGVDTSKLRHFLITHNHFDHFIADNFIGRPEGMGEMNVYVSPGSGEAFAARCEKLAAAPVPKNLNPINVPHVRLIRAFECFSAGDYEVTALEAAHAAGLEALNYLIVRGEEAVLWLHDSGMLTESTKQWLSEHCPKLSLVSMDCALPDGDVACKEHMNLRACADTADFLRRIGCVDEETRLVLSHISHNTRATHEQLLSEGKAYGFRLAFDGELIEL